MRDWLLNLARQLEALGRKTFALVCFAIFLIPSFGLGSIFDSYIEAGSIFWCILMSMFVKNFLLSVPEVTGLLTVNLITGELKPYKTGIHWRFPWEQVKDGNYINLRKITEDMPETYPAKDGPLMEVKWSFQYEPVFELLETYIKADDNTIKKGLKDVGSSLLSSLIAGTDSDVLKEKQAEIEQSLKQRFEDMAPTPRELYGIKLIRVSLADLDYPAKVQKVRETEQIAKKILGIAAKIKKERPGVSDKDALNAAMILNGDVPKTVTEVEGEGGQALAALLIAMSKGGK